MFALAAGSAARAQVLPDPDRLVPFAPIAYNGPLAGVGGLPPPLGGPGQFRVNFLHIQAQPGAGAGPGYEATYVNNPQGGDWQFILPEGEVVSTEILAFTLP